jgi:ABC-2 type transport system ATP-binding protein
MDAAIVTEGLSKRFGNRSAVEHLDLVVAHGQIFGFLGPNGAGKTTTIGMLLGLIRPTTGRVYLLGFDVAREPARALAGVGAMIEAPAFYPYLSARDNLRVLARAAGLPINRVDVVLGKVELSERSRDKFRAYAQGMKQRLAIAAALLPDPRLIILDEPTNGLDPAGQREIRQLIRDLASSGHTIFLSSHLLHEVEQLCDQVAILRRGRVVARGAVAELLRRGQGIFLRVAGEVGPAIELLGTVAWVRGVERSGDALLVDAPTERAAEITMLLAERSIAVAEIRANEQRLEDFFLEVTRT